MGNFATPIHNSSMVALTEYYQHGGDTMCRKMVIKVSLISIGRGRYK